jgi:hypothetical protein
LAGVAGAATGAAGAAAGAGLAAVADFLAGFAGRLLPNEPLNIFPFLVFLSPLPIVIIFFERISRSGEYQSYKKPRYLHKNAR